MCSLGKCFRRVRVGVGFAFFQRLDQGICATARINFISHRLSRLLCCHKLVDVPSKISLSLMDPHLTLVAHEIPVPNRSLSSLGFLRSSGSSAHFTTSVYYITDMITFKPSQRACISGRQNFRVASAVHICRRHRQLSCEESTLHATISVPSGYSPRG